MNRALIRIINFIIIKLKFEPSSLLNINVPLLDLKTYFKFLAFVFIIASFILLFVKEQEDESNEQLTAEETNQHILEEGLIATFNKMKAMSKNKALRQFIPLILISKVGQIFNNKLTALILLEKGFSRETLTNISTLLIPVDLLISYNLSKIKSKFLSLHFLKGYYNLIFLYLAELLLLITFEFNLKFMNYYLLIAFIIALSIIKTYYTLLSFNSMNGFFHKISDNKIGATYITALASASNLSEKWPGIFVFYFVDKFGFVFVGLLSILYCLIYFKFTQNLFKQIENRQEKEWKVGNFNKKIDDKNKIKLN